jgi:replication factor A1
LEGSKVNQLGPYSKGDNLKLKVLHSNTVIDKTRPDGSRVRVAEILVGDDTGCVILTARNGLLVC